MSSVKPTFAIMGTGGVGGYFGARLVKAGFTTSFIARGAHLDAMRSSGLKIEEPGNTYVVPVKAVSDPAEIGPVDFVLFAVKLWDTESAGALCKPLLGPDTAVISLQNGISSEDTLSRVLGASHVMGGVAEIFATIGAPGLIKKVSPFGNMKFGELDNAKSERAARLAKAVGDAGITFEHAADINLAIWQKFVFLVASSSMTALTRHPIGDIRGNAQTRELLGEIMDEVVAVGRAQGVAFAPEIKAQFMKRIDGMVPEMRASMAHDLLAGRRLELPWLAGAVVAKGRELGVATPANSFVVRALALDVNGAA